MCTNFTTPLELEPREMFLGRRISTFWLRNNELTSTLEILCAHSHCWKILLNQKNVILKRFLPVKWSEDVCFFIDVVKFSQCSSCVRPLPFEYNDQTISQLPLPIANVPFRYWDVQYRDVVWRSRHNFIYLSSTLEVFVAHNLHRSVDFFSSLDQLVLQMCFICWLFFAGTRPSYLATEQVQHKHTHTQSHTTGVLSKHGVSVKRANCRRWKRKKRYALYSFT